MKKIVVKCGECGSEMGVRPGCVVFDPRDIGRQDRATRYAYVCPVCDMSYEAELFICENWNRNAAEIKFTEDEHGSGATSK